MNRFFSLILAAALSLFIQSEADSQITITATDMPNYFGVGNSEFTYISSDSEAMYIGMASSSSSQTWTDPSPTIQDSLRDDNVDPSSTPFSAYFPGATYAQKLDFSESSITEAIYNYYRVSNDSLISMGYGESMSSVSMDTSFVHRYSQLFFPLPLQLGDVFTAIVDTTSVPFLGGGNIITAQTVATIDAYGTLNLPNGSFGALRETAVTTTKKYYAGVLTDSSTAYSISWYTKEGYELTVSVDSGSSGTVMVHSLVLHYPGKTPATVIETSVGQPQNYMLAQNYPNPFNPTTVISYQLSAVSNVSLKVYDILGREVATLVNEKQNAGSYSVTFDGSRLASGVYFYKLAAGNFVSVKKLVVLK